MLIRTATIEDLQQIAEVEAACFSTSGGSN